MPPCDDIESQCNLALGCACSSYTYGLYILFVTPLALLPPWPAEAFARHWYPTAESGLLRPSSATPLSSVPQASGGHAVPQMSLAELQFLVTPPFPAAPLQLCHPPRTPHPNHCTRAGSSAGTLRTRWGSYSGSSNDR